MIATQRELRAAPPEAAMRPPRRQQHRGMGQSAEKYFPRRAIHAMPIATFLDPK